MSDCLSVCDSVSLSEKLLDVICLKGKVSLRVFSPNSFLIFRRRGGANKYSMCRYSLVSIGKDNKIT